MRVQEGTASPRAVRAALAAYLKECEDAGTEPVSETYRFYSLMEKRVPTGADDLSPWAQIRAAERFRVQVLRELNLLAAQGVLVKRGDRRDLRFYTPAAAKEADEREEGRLHEAEAARKQVRKLSSRLEALGFDVLVQAGAPIGLDTEDWEVLVKLAERGRAAAAGSS